MAHNPNLENLSTRVSEYCFWVTIGFATVNWDCEQTLSLHAQREKKKYADFFFGLAEFLIFFLRIPT